MRYLCETKGVTLYKNIKILYNIFPDFFSLISIILFNKHSIQQYQTWQRDRIIIILVIIAVILISLTSRDWYEIHIAPREKRPHSFSDSAALTFAFSSAWKCRRCLVSVSPSRRPAVHKSEVMIPHNVSRGRLPARRPREGWRPHYAHRSQRGVGGSIIHNVTSQS